MKERLPRDGHNRGWWIVAGVLVVRLLFVRVLHLPAGPAPDEQRC